MLNVIKKSINYFVKIIRTEIPLREIIIERLWQEVQELRTKVETHNHLTFGSQGLTGTVNGILQSPNFITGSSGWQIKPDGTIEANSGTFRGTINATAGYFGNITNGVSIGSTGLELTGTGYIRTGSSGERVVINNSIIEVYDTNGLSARISGNTGSAIYEADINSASDSRGLRIIANNTSGVLEAAAIVVKGNQKGLFVSNENNNLVLQYLLGVDVDSSHASRTTAAAGVRFRNLNKGTCFEASSGSSATGPSIYSLHSNLSGIGWQLTFDNNSNASNALFINKTSTGAGYPLQIVNSGVKETNFKRIADFAGVSLYISDGTTPDGNLTGVVGDICLNGPGGVTYYCDTAGKNWTAM